MTDNVDTYDFRRPNQLADDVEQLLIQWQQAFLKVAKGAIAENFGFAFDWEPGEMRTVTLSDLVDSQPDPALVMQHDIGGHGIGWIVMPRQIILSVFDQVFGNPFEALPEDRELSGIEESLFGTLTKEIEFALTTSQPCEDVLPCIVNRLPKFAELTHAFSEAEQIVVVDLALRGDFDGQAFQWYLSQQAVLRMVTHVAESSNESNCPRPELERLLHQIPMNVVVNLGRTKLSWSELTQLCVGDVIKLNQRISEPLEALVTGNRLFRGFAGRHGNSQAFRISELVEPEAA